VVNQTVLLIDDSPALHALVKVALAADGLEVHGALNGVEGVAAAKQLFPDMILLDLEMPGPDGFEVCEMLASLPETLRIPVIFLSAASEPDLRARGLNAGASDFISKPFHADELRARVRVALRYKALLEMEARRGMHDGLTGLWNRKYLDERLAAELKSSHRHGRPLACIMFDLDHFKALNDVHGHATGDAALRALGELLQATGREEDVACRYGGEEFVVLCPNVDAEGATVLAERLRELIAKMPIPTAAGSSPTPPEVKPLHITASFGVADRLAGDDLLSAADAALYRAKRQGRNRVVTTSAVVGLAD
jgi:diguanylate cyclase (GGDEF)-like protein